ncbi:aspartate/glutamate racemase family protein [Thermodesulfobacteriota bacterium]
MKKIGIIGGLGPESTVDYYKGIIETCRRYTSQTTNPEMVIYSADVYMLLKFMEEEKWERLTDWLVDRIDALRRAGAEFAAIGSNTPHIVFDDVAQRSPLPLLSIIDETCRFAYAMNLKKIGLMGTRFTMQSDFFQAVFHRKGMSLVVPHTDEIEWIHQKLMSEIELGVIKDSTRNGLLSIAKRLIDENAIEGLILGCTELPMILDQDAYGIPFLNTTAIHIDSIVKYSIDE